MKILHVIETLGCGGAERLLVTVLPELKRLGHDVAVAVRRGPCDLEPDLTALDIPVIRLPKRHKWSLVFSARDIARAMPDADIIHAHLYFPAVCTALARLLGLSRARTCVTFHNLAYAGANRDGFKLRLRKALARRVYRRGILAKLAVSRAVADHYSDALALENVTVLYNPIDLAEVDATRQAPKPSDAPLHIVLPGRLVPEKGHADLIAALRDPRLTQQSLTVTFAGHGKLHDTLKNLAKDLPFPLTFTGQLDHASFLEMLATADIVVVPSRYEGFGLTALEAMSLSKPVIASRAGGLPEVMGDTGRLVDIGDMGALSSALLEVADHPELRETMGQAARKRAESQFGLPAIVSRLNDVYTALCDTRTPSSPETP